jgi:hypothetical protein
MRKFKVTANAGLWVAGLRVNDGDVLTLTPRQAEYELLRGALVYLTQAEEAQLLSTDASIEEATAQLARNTDRLAGVIKGGI